jgi:hypothetical protein
MTTPTRTEIRFRFDDALARTASRRFLSRYQRGMMVYVAICALVAALFALQHTWWAVSAFATIAAIYTTIMVKSRRGATRMTRRPGAPEVTVSVDENGMNFSMPSYQSIAAWSPMREIWIFDDVWIFFPFGMSAAYSAVPAAAMTPEFRDIVLNGMRAGGGVVR